PRPFDSIRPLPMRGRGPRTRETGGRTVLILEGHTDAVRDVAFQSGGPLLASTGLDVVVRLWDTVTGPEISSVDSPPHWGTGVVFSPDGAELAVALQSCGVSLWDTRTWRQRAALGEQFGTVLGLAFSPGGAVLASAGADGMVRLWDAATGQAG